MPMKGKGPEEIQKELAVIEEVTKRKFPSRADMEKFLTETARKKGISPERISAMCREIKEK
jgi:hypothetical protein